MKKEIVQQNNNMPQKKWGNSSQKMRNNIRYFKRYWVIYAFLIPAFLDLLIFRYAPMYGIVLAFKDYRVKKGILGSEWVGLKHFIKFVESPNFVQILTNTLGLSISLLVFSFPIPIILALMLNEVNNQKVKKVAQMVTYMPHFISVTAVIGLIRLMVDPNSGILNMIIVALGGEARNFIGMESAFRPIYIISEIWQHTGWGTIIYISALSNVDVESLESARVDGVNRFQKIWYIDIPTILPTIVVLFIMRTGSILSVGFEKVYLLQNDLTRDVSEMISTYTYRLGILGGQFSYTTAIGLFNNIINIAVLIIVNQISRKVSDTSVW